MRVIPSILIAALLAVAARAADLPETFAPLPQPVTSFGAAEHNGWLYVFGGHLGKAHTYSRDTATGALRRLSLADGFTWEELPSATPAQSPALVVHAGTLVRVAGMRALNDADAKADLRSLDEVARFDPVQKLWLPLPALPEPRSSHDAIVVGHTLHVIGGWKLAGESEKAKWHDTRLTLDLGNPAAKWQSHPQPFQRRALAVVATDTHLYALGGMDDSDSTSDAVDVLDLVTGQWSQGPAVPGGGRMRAFGAAACVVGGKLYLTGYGGDVLRLSDKGDAWETVTKLQSPRFFARLIPVDAETLLVVGGESKGGHRADIEVIRLTKDGTAGTWPQFRGPRRDGYSRETGWAKQWPSEGPAVLWKKNVGKGLSSFAVADGRAFTLGNTDDTDTVFAFDAAAGRELWTHRYASALSAHKESIVPGGPASTPLVDGDRVFTLGRHGELHCLDAATGKILWAKHLVKDFGAKRPVYGYSVAPLIHGDLLIVDAGGPGASTLALKKSTGELAWKAGDREAGYSAPISFTHEGREVFALFKGDALVALDALDGCELWAQPWETRDFCNVATPVRAAERLFVSSTGSGGAAMFAWRGQAAEKVWQNGELGLLFNSPVLWRGLLLGFNDARRDAREFKALDARTGAVKWSFDGLDKGSFVVGDDHVIALSSKGELAVGALAPDGFTINSRAQVLGGKTYAPVVLAGAKVFCRNNDGDVVVLDVRAPAEPAAKTASAK